MRGGRSDDPELASAGLTAEDPAGHLHPVLATLFKALEVRGIRWALLRLPQGGLLVPRGDIDIVIHPDDFAGAASVFRELAFSRMPRRGDAAHFLRYCVLDDQWLWVHAEPAVGFGPGFPLSQDAAADVFGKACLAGSVRLLPSDTSFWSLLWHCLADKGHVALHHRRALARDCASADAGSEVARTLGRACGDAGLPARLIELVSGGRWSAVDACAAAIRPRAHARGPSALLRGIVGRTRRGLGAGRRWRDREGLTVAILGPDGAGKSTLVAGIERTVPLPSTVIYMGLTGGALRHTRRLRVPGLVFGAGALVIWGRYLRARYHKARGRLVLFERYVYDAVAPHPERLTFPRRLARQLSGRLCPMPDCVLLLDAPGDIMFARKGEYTAEMLETWRQHFRNLGDRLPALQIIDATRDAETVRIDAVERIWRIIARRWDAAAASG